MIRSAKDRDAHGRVLEDNRQPQCVGFLDRSHLRAHYLRLDARDQFARGERLDEIVVRSGLQPLDARLFAGTRRQQNHRYGLRPLVGTQALQQLEPVEPRHHDVGDDHVGAVRMRRRQRGCAIAHGFDRPSVAEQTGDVLPHVGVVVGHEHARDRAVDVRFRRPCRRSGGAGDGSHRNASCTYGVAPVAVGADPRGRADAVGWQMVAAGRQRSP